MKYFPLFVFLFLGLLIYISPVEVFAQDPTGLVPCDGTTENPCNSCQLVVLGENILQWLIGVMLVIFAIMVAISGFNLVTSGGNPQAKTEAKKKLTNSFVAIVIVLAAWLIVDTLMRSLLLGGEGQINGRPWSTLECINATETTMPNKNELSPTLQQVEDLKAMGCQFKNGREGWYCPNTSCRYRETEGWYNCAEGEVPPAPPVRASTPGTLSEEEVRSSLASAGINVSSTGGCTDPNIATCTGLEGLRGVTVQSAIDLKNACNCDITITGGTEVGHAMNDGHDHSSGYKYDISLNGAVNTYIESNFRYSGVRSDGAYMYTDPATGDVYAKEGNHWDILVNGG